MLGEELGRPGVVARLIGAPREVVGGLGRLFVARVAPDECLPRCQQLARAVLRLEVRDELAQVPTHPLALRVERAQPRPRGLELGRAPRAPIGDGEPVERLGVPLGIGARDDLQAGGGNRVVARVRGRYPPPQVEQVAVPGIRVGGEQPAVRVGRRPPRLGLEESPGTRAQLGLGRGRLLGVGAEQAQLRECRRRGRRGGRVKVGRSIESDRLARVPLPRPDARRDDEGLAVACVGTRDERLERAEGISLVPAASAARAASSDASRATIESG